MSSFFRTSLVASLLIALASPAIAQSPQLSFPDVPHGHQYFDAVTYVQTQGIVQGYPDGTFGPDKTINRAEFTKIVVGARFSGEEIDGCSGATFRDVPAREWFYPYVCQARLRGIIDGFPDGTFGPKKDVKFVEAAKILAATFGGIQPGGEPWFRTFVEYLGSQGAIPTNIPAFEHPITRGQMAEMLYRLRASVTTKPTRTYAQMSAVPAIRYERKSVQTPVGTFDVDVLMGDLFRGVKVVTDSATSSNCDRDCPALPLKEYIDRNDAAAGIHGSYFCPPDYDWCSDKINSYIYYMYAASSQSFINPEKRSYDNAGGVFYFGNSWYKFSEDATILEPEMPVTGAIAMWPALVANGEALPDHPMMDEKQRTGRGPKGGLGINEGGTVYLLIARNATVPDLREIMLALDLQHGINLDGGGSSAMYVNGAYKVGPGRKLPNAILLVQ